MIHPRWSLWAGVITLAAIFVGLGIWQLSRLAERREHNRSALARLQRPTVDAADSIPAPWQRVVARGQWDYEHEVVLRGQSLQDAPGVVLITPLRLAGRDTALLVARGFVPSDDAITTDPQQFREGSSAAIAGVTLPLRAYRNAGAPLRRDGGLTVARLDIGTLRAALPFPIYDVFLVLENPRAGAGWPRRSALPPLTDGPHLSYALQWFGFAAVLVGGAVLWSRREGRGGGNVGRSGRREGPGPTEPWER